MILTYYFIGLIVTAGKRILSDRSKDTTPKGSRAEELTYWLVYSPLTWPKFIFNVVKKSLVK